MIHFLWSIFFFLCSVALIFFYVGSVISVIFFLHYIIVERWQYWDGKYYTLTRRIIFLIGRLIAFLLIPSAIALGYIFIEARIHNNWKPYVDTENAAVMNHTILIISFGFVFLLILNVLNIRKQRKINSSKDTKSFLTYYKNKFVGRVIVFILIILITIYVGGRQKWMGRDNANISAKQYWVAGQVLQGFRMLLTRYLHPELCLMAPLNSLQHWIFEKGIQFIPESDGERAVWENAWFFYHYTRLNRMAFMTIEWKGESPGTVALLDKWWHCLEGMATKTYADNQMEEDHYYQEFASLALNYTFFEGMYSGGGLTGSREKMAQKPKYVERSRKLAKWLTELREKWQSSQKSRKLLAEFPKGEAMCQYALLCQLRNVIQGEIYSRKFKCTNSSVQRYVALRKEFFAPENGLPASKRIKDKVASNTLYNWVRSQIHTQYIIERFCGYNVEGKGYFKDYEYWAKLHHRTLEEEVTATAKGVYKKEIKILEDMYHGE